MNISRKIFVILSLGMIAIFSIAAYFYYKSQLASGAEELEALGKTTGSALEQSLNISMMTKDYNTILETLHSLKDIKPIMQILLVNREGIVKASTDEKFPGIQLSPEDIRSMIIHEEKAKGVFLKREKMFVWIQPVINKPICHGCHDQKVKVNGAFVIDYSISEIEQRIKKNLIKGFLILIASFALAALVENLLAKKLVIDRLNTLTETIKRFSDGDYTARMTIKKDDEITRLEEGFNKMAVAINEREMDKTILFEKISTSQKIWQETFDSITDMISIHDRDFNLLKVNKAFAEYFGFHPKDAINKKCYEIFHGTNSPVEGCPHAISVSEHRPTTADVLNSKTNKIFRISTFPFYFPEAEFVGSIHIAKDITEEKEKELRLIMSERLAALGQMASGIAHEINNPLASIAGCTDGLLSRVKSGKFDPILFEDYLKIIEEEISRCKDITIGMLSFVREKTYEKKAININEALDKTLEIIGFQGRLKGLKIIRNYKAALPVYASEGELRQVFMAIITNAIDAMQDKGTLTLETGNEKEYVFAKISDTGTGIPPENISRIFTPFFTTKSDKGGTGLGLSIAKEIITENNGNITVASEQDKGTIFTITLPSSQ